MQDTYRHKPKPSTIYANAALPEVDPDKIELWRQGNKEMRNPIVVEGDDII